MKNKEIVKSVRKIENVLRENKDWNVGDLEDWILESEDNFELNYGEVLLIVCKKNNIDINKVLKDVEMEYEDGIMKIKSDELKCNYNVDYVDRDIDYIFE